MTLISTDRIGSGDAVVPASLPARASQSAAVPHLAGSTQPKHYGPRTMGLPIKRPLSRSRSFTTSDSITAPDGDACSPPFFKGLRPIGDVASAWPDADVYVDIDVPPTLPRVDTPSPLPCIDTPSVSPAVHVRPPMPETDFHTPEGYLRRDVVMKVLERIDDRLTQLIEESDRPTIRLAAQRQRHTIQSLVSELAAKGDSAATDCLSLDSADSEKLIHVLRETRKSVCSRPSLISRILQWLLPAADKKTCNSRPEALLDMLLEHFDVQAMGAYAALVREKAEAFRVRAYADYAHAGTSRSTFLGGTGTLPIGDPLTVSAGLVVGATFLGRDLAACEDGDIEQSKWTSHTTGLSLAGQFWGFLKAAFSVTGTGTRKQGVFFSDVDHLVKSREGKPHNQAFSDGVTGPLKHLMRKGRFTFGNHMRLSDLDALQDKAYAQRDIFAKIVGPISMSAAGADAGADVDTDADTYIDDTLRMIAVNSRVVEVPPPCDFVATKTETAASVNVGLAVVGLNATGTQSLLDLTIQSRKGFWQAIRDDHGDGTIVALEARKERVAALRAESKNFNLPLLLDTATLDELQVLLKDMNQEFDNYCYARRQIAAGVPRHARYVDQARGIEAKWGVKQSHDALYAYVQRMHIMRALIGLQLQQLGQSDERLFDQFERALEAPDITGYSHKKAEPYITFSNETDLLERCKKVELGAGLQVPIAIGLGLTVKVSAQVRTRRDWNILRDGNYVDLSINPTVTLSTPIPLPVPEVVELLLRCLSNLGLDQSCLGPSIEKFANVLKTSLAPSLEGGHTPGLLPRIRLCLYQPGITRNMKEMRLQYVRYTSGCSGPMIDKEIFTKQSLGTETLSYIFMRHHAFFSHPNVDKRKAYWDAYCAPHAKDLGEMMAGLGTPESLIRAEADGYWEQTLGCATDDFEKQRLIKMREVFDAAMSNYARAWSTNDSDPVAYEIARSALDRFAEAHMTPWLQARARRVRHKACFKLLS